MFLLGIQLLHWSRPPLSVPQGSNRRGCRMDTSSLHLQCETTRAGSKPGPGRRPDLVDRVESNKLPDSSLPEPPSSKNIWTWKKTLKKRWCRFHLHQIILWFLVNLVTNWVSRICPWPNFPPARQTGWVSVPGGRFVPQTTRVWWLLAAVLVDCLHI